MKQPIIQDVLALAEAMSEPRVTVARNALFTVDPVSLSHMTELVFEVVQEIDGGYCAELCVDRIESVTRGDYLVPGILLLKAGTA